MVWMGKTLPDFSALRKGNFRTVNVCAIVELRVQFVFKIDLVLPRFMQPLRETTYHVRREGSVAISDNVEVLQYPAKAVRALQAHSRYYVPNSLLFATIFRGSAGARAKARILKKLPPGLKAGAPTVRRKRRINSIAACRAVPHELRASPYYLRRGSQNCF